MRCGPKIDAEETASTCFHHEKLLLSIYYILQNTLVVIHSKTTK
jgi:hypothetical protein